MEIIVTAIYNFDGLNKYPLLKMFENQLGDLFMEHRNEVANEFNKHIERINNLWDKLGIEIKPTEYCEDIDPRYTSFINEHLQPYIDELNIKLKKEGSIWEYYLNEYSDIAGRLYEYPDVTLDVTFKQESE